MEKNKHITEPDVFGYQVRIVRRGKEVAIFHINCGVTKASHYKLR